MVVMEPANPPAESASHPPAGPALIYVLNGAPFFLSHRLALAQAAQQRGFSIHVAAPGNELADKIEAHGFRYHSIPLSRKGANPFEEFATLRALVTLYRAVRPRLVHHLTIKPVLYGTLAARLTAVPCVVNAVTGMGHIFTAGGVKAAILREAVKTAYRVLLNHPNSRVIFQNPDDQREFSASRLIAHEQGILIRGSGVDTELFSPRPEPDGPPLVLFAGRLIWDKGVREFIDAAERLRRKGISARFVIAGESDEGNPEAVPPVELQRWHDSGVVEWWGRRDDMPEVFAQSHIVCFPSYYREGIPKVLIEAASCGRPIITTDSPGCREAVQDRISGLLVPPKDSNAVVAAVESLLADASLRRRMGSAGRKLALRDFALENIIAQTLEVYAGVLAGSRR